MVLQVVLAKEEDLIKDLQLHKSIKRIQNSNYNCVTPKLNEDKFQWFILLQSMKHRLTRNYYDHIVVLGDIQELLYFHTILNKLLLLRFIRIHHHI